MTLRIRSANIVGALITATGMTTSNGIDVSSQSSAAYDQANTARSDANTTFATVNTTFGTINTNYQAAYSQANTARSDANTTFATVNTTFGTVNTSLGTINTNYQAAYSQANAARSDANTTFATVNTTFSTLNTSAGSQNTAITNAHDQANSARGQANTAYAQANAAYAAANLRVSTSGGSISGDLAITGNLTVQGNATTINVSNLSVNDSMILLATGGVGDSNDIGFIGHIQRGATDTHAGLIRKATENRFYLFDNYEVEPTNNVIDVTGNNFRVGNIRLGIINANSFVTSAGLDVTGQANAAYTQANNAYAAANNRVLKAGDTMTGQLNISSGGLLVTGTAQATYFYGLAAGTNDSANFGNSQSNLRIGGNGSHVTLNAAPWGFNLIAGSGSGTTALYVNTSGNVGVGTSSPETLLHVKSTSAYPAFLFESANTAIYAGPYLNLRNPSLSTNFGETSIQHTLLDPNDLTNVVFQIQQRTTSSSFVRQILVYDYKNQNWSFLTNGSERLKIDSSGNTSIGTSSTPVRLCVQTSGNGNLDGIQVKSPSGHFMDFRPAAAQGGNNGLVSANDQAIIFSGTAVNTGNLVIAPWATSTGGLKITSNGFIGVGTTTPNGAFHIATTNNVAPILKLETTGNSTNSAFWIEDQDGNVAARAIATMDLSAGLGLFNLYAGAYTASSGNHYGSTRGASRIGMSDNIINFFTANASGGGQSTGTAVTWYQTLSSSNASFIVYTNYGTERLRIDANGNVGIGTTSPIAKTEINQAGGLAFRAYYGSGANRCLDINIDRGNGDARLMWNANNITGSTYAYITSNYSSGIISGDGLAFLVAGSGTAGANIAYTQALTILSGGNVGVGTAAPVSRLDVSGVISLSGINFAQYSANYNRIHEPSGNVAFYIGNNTDQANYSDNTTHYFRARGGGTQFVYINSNGIYNNGWFRPTGNTGLYFENTSAGFWSPLAAGATYGNITTYGTGRNGWSGYGATTRYTFMSNGTTVGLHDVNLGWIIRWPGDTATFFDLGYTQAAGSFRAPIFYDSDDTNAYYDGGGAFIMRGGSPTIYFRDTDHNSAMLHCNSSLLYVLRGANDTTGWTQVSGQWPFIFNLTNNDATCGGSFSAIGNVTAYSSDKRLKINIKNIPNALDKVLSLNGVTFDWVDRVKELGFTPDTMINDAGVIAQEVQEVLPQAVKPAPFDYQWDNDKNANISRSGENFITVQYEKIVPLLIEAIKELKAEIDTLKQRG